MATADDSEPAFPGYTMEADDKSVSITKLSPGMSLRDYFAAKALQVEFASACMSKDNAGALCRGASINGVSVARRMADNAYEIADAMLAARSK